jgi:hypothetical protein
LVRFFEAWRRACALGLSITLGDVADIGGRKNGHAGCRAAGHSDSHEKD